MYELKKIGKVLMSESVGTRLPFYEKRIHRAAVSQRLRNTGLEATSMMSVCRQVSQHCHSLRFLLYMW